MIPMKLITIVCESVLRDPLVRRIRAAGARGCSYTSTQGVGQHEDRTDDVFSANFELKVVCPSDVADKILADIADHYFGKYAIVLWVSDVEVIRESHFRK